MDPKIMLVSGDLSGDRFGSVLAEGMFRLNPQVSLFGVGGPRMAAEGVSLLSDLTEMVSLGAFQTFKGSHVANRLLKRVAEAIEREQPSLVVQIGLPVFNLRLLEIVQTKSIPVLYYYTPLSQGLQSIKLDRFKSLVTKVAALSRFEAAVCAEAGLDAEFVGHPLMDLIDFSPEGEKVRRELQEDSEKPAVIAIAPGTREIEVKNVLPPVLKSLGGILKKHPDLEVVLILASTIGRRLVEKISKRCNSTWLRVEQDDSFVLGAADLAVTSVGTCSLEASLQGVPSVAVYRGPGTTFSKDKLLDRRPYVTLTNNILRKTVIPEYIQGGLSPAVLGAAIEQLLFDGDERRAMLAEFARLPEELGGPGAVQRGADLILKMAECETNGTESDKTG